jgi:hypothetical protein
MSEKVYAWLLRLYPLHFREEYGDAALQLFRDRSRQERGFFPSLRLWLDLFADLAISLPLQHYYTPPELAGVSAQKRGDGTPSFHILEGESPGPGALLLGGLVLVGAINAAFQLGNLASRHPLPGASLAHYENSAEARRAPAGGGDPQPLTPAQHTSALPPPSVPKTEAPVRRHIIQAAIANLREHYVDRDAADKVADVLQTHRKNGDYDAVTDGAALAGLLTRHMRDASMDRHLILVYSESPLPGRPPGPTPDGLRIYRKAMERDNCTFEKTEILPHNIGYLKLNSFPDPSVCQPLAAAAMASLNRADAVIFDLRENGGGHPGMVKLIANYLFDRPEYLYNPRENTTQLSWTQSPVPGNRLADKPVYLLTSARTASGAEQFSYDLKMLKRATLIGETTRGSAHSGVFYRLDEHFGIGIPEARPINPFSTEDWEGTGVEPNVKVKAEDALLIAQKLAESKLRRK